MKTVLTILSVILLAILGYIAYGLDQWLGIVAFTYPYLLFCAVAALLYWAAWFPILRKRAIVVALAVFAILSSNFLLPPPSERILRSVLLRIPPCTSSDSIETIVKEEYEGSGYVLPQITREDARIHVSLLSQRSGNCTALIIKTEDGVVVSSEYSADQKTPNNILNRISNPPLLYGIANGQVIDDHKSMKYKSPKFDTFVDYRRFMVRVFVLLYIVVLLGIMLKWLLDGGAFWPYAAAAVTTLPCFVLGYFMGMPRAKFLFDKARSEYVLPKMK